MKRSELELLSAAELQQLIADAASVLADRASPSTAAVGAASLSIPTLGAGAGPSTGGSLFTFGSPSAAAVSASPLGSGSVTGGSLFTFGSPLAAGGAASPPQNSGLFSASGGSCSFFGADQGGGAATLGSGKLFGGTGGGLFSSATVAATTAAAPSGTGSPEAAAAEPAKRDAEEDDGNDLVQEEEEVTAVHGWTPTITLEVLESTTSGEEDEEEVYSQRSKLYRYRDAEWKERGLGEARLLKDRASGRVRFLLRQEKTGKIVANFYVIDHAPYCDLRPNAESDKIWVWSAQDFSEGALEVQQLALKFGSAELAAKFKSAFDEAKLQNSKVLAMTGVDSSSGGCGGETADTGAVANEAFCPPTRVSAGSGAKEALAE